MTPRAAAILSRLAVAVVILAGSGLARAQTTGDVTSPPPIYDFKPVGEEPNMPKIEPITTAVPLLGDDARAEGVSLPLPFGVSTTYTYIQQNMVVENLRLNGQPIGLNIEDAKTVSHTAVVRGDLWLFPFLNLYGLIGYTAGETTPRIKLRNGETIGQTVSYDRLAWGVGGTAAGGWKAYFLTLDANYTSGAIQSEKGQIGERALGSITFAPRIGSTFSSGHFGIGALWIGGMFIDTTDQIQDTVDLAAIDPSLPPIVGQRELSYSLNVTPKNPWNLLLGGSWQIDQRWSLTVELGGVLDRFQAIGNVMFRF
jgi:hypothetical protein